MARIAVAMVAVTLSLAIAQDPDDQQWFTLEMDVLPEQREAFLEVFAECRAGTLKETGILQYDLLANASNPNMFNLWQGYKTMDVAKNHMKQPYTLKMLKAASTMLVKPPAQMKYEQIHTSSFSESAMDRDGVWFTLQIHILPDKHDDFLALFEECRIGTLKEIGILQYDLLVNAAAMTRYQNQFNLWQGYKSMDVAKNHMMQPYTVKMLEGVKTMLAEQPVMTTYKWSNPADAQALMV